jgi:hypothetical protein
VKLALKALASGRAAAKMHEFVETAKRLSAS